MINNLPGDAFHEIGFDLDGCHGDASSRSVMTAATCYDSGIGDGGSRLVYEGDQYRPNRTIMAMADAQRLKACTQIIKHGYDV